MIITPSFVNNLMKISSVSSADDAALRDKTEKAVAEILAIIERNGPTETIDLRFSGDISRYHEMITLDCTDSHWLLDEDYLTPEYSFKRSTNLPCFSGAEAQAWLEMLFTLNPVLLSSNAACPKNGLALPDRF